MSLYFEDFTVGVEHVTRGRTITESDIMNFAGPQLRTQFMAAAPPGDEFARSGRALLPVGGMHG